MTLDAVAEHSRNRIEKGYGSLGAPGSICPVDFRGKLSSGHLQREKAGVFRCLENFCRQSVCFYWEVGEAEGTRAPQISCLQYVI